jgi:hypothetical protein
MMGPKTAAEYREALRKHFSEMDEDPFDWLEKRMAESPKDSRVLQALWEFLKGPVKPKSKRTRSSTKARTTKKR